MPNAAIDYETPSRTMAAMLYSLLAPVGQTTPGVVRYTNGSIFDLTALNAVITNTE